MGRRVVLLLVVAFALMSGCRPCWADAREYLETLPYFTVPEGETQINFWNDWFSGLPRNQIQIEHGFTPRLEASIYGTFQNLGEGDVFNSTEVEVRYRLAKYKTWIADPSIYVSYQKGAMAGQADVGEAILMLSKDFGDLNVTGNARWEQDLEGGGSPVEFSYTLAAAYPVSKKTRFGVEGVFQPSSGQNFLIPGVYLTLGKNLWMNLGVSIAMQPATTPLNPRSIIWYAFPTR